MRLCRFDDDRLGVVRGGMVHDVSTVLDHLPPVRWPAPPGDALMARLEALRPEIESLAEGAPATPLAGVRLLSPVANPDKIIGAPVNYAKHLDEARADAEIHHGQEIKTIDHYGLFLKANSSLVGPGKGVTLRFTDRRNDHEAELCAVIGMRGRDIPRDQAMDHVLGYAIGLDMTVRGTEERSLRKSIDSYSVIGPWLVTADEIPEPGSLDLELKVNGETRQKSNTRYLIFDIPRLIEYASAFYTLHPGDIIMTGTPEGVGPVVPGDVIEVEIEAVGRMQVAVRG
ncbi:MAG: fumarylacetoacetate hydrolase family protein [Planctomycetota bacterium]|jgi:2-keto-4-pentenoate hydratase/2-oxohepta-3-ene-1,7-dioic acid hydratase in catechol pathway